MTLSQGMSRGNRREFCRRQGAPILNPTVPVSFFYRLSKATQESIRGHKGHNLSRGSQDFNSPWLRHFSLNLP